VTLFVSLAETSQRVGATAARLGKVRELATLLEQLAPEEVGPAVQYLSGEMPQGRIGIGPAAVGRAAAPHPPPVATH
jgi:DNA ligase-1